VLRDDIENKSDFENKADDDIVLEELGVSVAVEETVELKDIFTVGVAELDIELDEKRVPEIEGVLVGDPVDEPEVVKVGLSDGEFEEELVMDAVEVCVLEEVLDFEAADENVPAPRRFHELVP